MVTIQTPYQPDNYVMIPACCYNGNQFEVLKRKYPPMFSPEEARLDMPITITDVPRLNKDGSGKIEVTTGDAATPAVGVFSATEQRGVLVFTVQQIAGKNVGLAYERGTIRLTWPAQREKVYRANAMHPNPSQEPEQDVDIPHKVLDFACGSLPEFYRVFFENRKIMGMDAVRPQVMPPEKQIEIHRDKFNKMNWEMGKNFYMVGTDRTRFQVWQPGWVGGAMSSYALMRLGGDLEWRRGIQTLDFLFETQAPSGLFHGIVDHQGNVFGDGFDVPGADNWHLIRKSADVLYFLFKHFRLMEQRGTPVPEAYKSGARKVADAFVRLWNRYGQFGQFVDVFTGDVVVGGSTSAGIAPAGLADAYRYFGDTEYLRVAGESAESYYHEHLCLGYTTGGPGEILQCVDSESAFGLLESFVTLYETTQDEKWLRYARECAHYCSSWTVSYNYLFPAYSEFARHDMKTVGSVFANIQNKHSAPGICTLSGDSLYKLYRWTGDELYLELVRDIALTISQYMSTKDKPIHSWDAPDDALRGGQPIGPIKGTALPPGFICERVNMSDWETARCVGGVFNGSCWSEVSNMLVLAEVVPLLA